MKKWMTILALILCVALLAVACKRTDNGKDPDTSVPQTTEAPTAETTTEAPTEEEPTDEFLPGGMEVITGDTGKFGPEIEPDKKN